MDPHSFAIPDLDPGSQNLADPTDPDADPKQCSIDNDTIDIDDTIDNDDTFDNDDTSDIDNTIDNYDTNYNDDTIAFVDSDYEVEMEEPVLLLPREDHEEDHFMY